MASSTSKIMESKTPESPESITIYETTYKKGNLLQRLHFRHEGSLTSAIAKVKAYCYRHHLMHIHTVPFLINLDESVLEDGADNLNGEVIDIEK